jgi:hypothetical protein
MRNLQGLSLRNILVAALLYIDASTEPGVSYLSKDICCQWCLPIVEVVVAIVIVSVLAVVNDAAVNAATVKALALTIEGYIWLAATLLALLSLAQPVVA